MRVMKYWRALPKRVKRQSMEPTAIDFSANRDSASEASIT